jgi:hypothetical protein
MIGIAYVSCEGEHRRGRKRSGMPLEPFFLNVSHAYLRPIGYEALNCGRPYAARCACYQGNLPL